MREKEKNEENTASLRIHVNENIFILFMLEYQIKFSAGFSSFLFGALRDEIIIN